MLRTGRVTESISIRVEIKRASIDGVFVDLGIAVVVRVVTDFRCARIDRAFCIVTVGAVGDVSGWL